MNLGTDISRRSVLKVLGVGGAIAIGSGTAVADGHPHFFARLSDNPSIPGHGKVRSRGRGRLDLLGDPDDSDVLRYELTVANLEQGAVAAHIHGGGRADGAIWVTLYEGEPINDETVEGTITDADVEDETVGGVRGLVWDELVEGNGVVNVHTGFEPGGEIAGIVRPRPVAGWIAV